MWGQASAAEAMALPGAGAASRDVARAAGRRCAGHGPQVADARGMGHWAWALGRRARGAGRGGRGGGAASRGRCTASECLASECYSYPLFAECQIRALGK